MHPFLEAAAGAVLVRGFEGFTVVVVGTTAAAALHGLSLGLFLFHAVCKFIGSNP